MRILMLGNSFTFYHRMPETLSEILESEIVSHTRGGARLAEQLNPETEMGAKTLHALKDEKWDYVVLQEQSIAPVTNAESFLKSAKELCDLIHANGAKPVFYATWAYREGSEKLSKTGLCYSEMARALQESYAKAAQAGNALLADVGKAFTRVRGHMDLYEAADDYHPTQAGSALAAAIIAKIILKDISSGI